MVSNVTVAHMKECRLSCVSEQVTSFKGSVVLCTYVYTSGSRKTGAGVVAAADKGYLLHRGMISRSTKECGRLGSLRIEFV